MNARSFLITENNRTTPRLSHGFTLIELLTVIAIIGILAAILIPVVGRVRDAAKNAVCTSNLRQWHSTVMLFVNDNDGQLPLASQVVPVKLPWPTALGAYAGYDIPNTSRAWWFNGIPEHIGTCPADRHEHGNTAGGTPPLGPEYYVSYALNTDAVGTHFSSPSSQTIGRTSMDMFNDYPQTILMTDRHQGWHTRYDTFNANAYRHNGRANMVLIGGAVYSATLSAQKDPPRWMWSPNYH